MPWRSKLNRSTQQEVQLSYFPLHFGVCRNVHTLYINFGELVCWRVGVSANWSVGELVCRRVVHKAFFLRSLPILPCNRRRYLA